MLSPRTRSVQRTGKHEVKILTTPPSPGGARGRRWPGGARAGECRHQHPPLRPRLQLERGRRGLRQKYVLIFYLGPWNVSYPKTIYDDCILCYYVWQKYCSWKIEFIGANLSWPLLTDPSKLGLPLILTWILKVVLCHEEVKSYFVSVSHVTVYCI